jgi:hypothetical protein
MLGQTGLGYVAQVQSFSSGYIIGGSFTFLAIPILFALRRLDKPNDYFTGEAGEKGVCAAQGLPDVSAIDSKARQAS